MASAKGLQITADGQAETSGDGESAEQSDTGLDGEQLTDHDNPGRSGSLFIVVDDRGWIVG